MRAFLTALVVFIATPAFASEPWMTKAIELLQDEQKVVEALFNQDSARSLWVSMRDDGTRRDGYAEYVCMVLSEAGMPTGGFTIIHIWDAAAMARGEMKEIGRNDCEKS